MGKTCLIIKNDGIGDLVLSSGIISELAERYQGGLDLLTIDENKEITKLIRGIRQCYFTSLGGSSIRTPLGGRISYSRIPKTELAELRRMKSTRYDVAISLRRYIRGPNLIAMKHANAAEKFCAWQILNGGVTAKVAGKYSRGWKHFQTETTSPRHELDYYARFLEGELGISGDFSPRLDLPQDLPVPDDGRIGLILGGRVSKWPLPSWIALTSKLRAEGYRIRLFGGPAQVELASHICDYGECENLAGKLSFSESVRPLAECSAVVANDTGFAHFASLVVPKLLIIYGGGTFRRFFPWPKSENQFVIFRGMDCFDCRWVCSFSHKFCLESIGAEDVFSYLREILTSNGVERQRDLALGKGGQYELVKTFKNVTKKIGF